MDQKGNYSQNENKEDEGYRRLYVDEKETEGIGSQISDIIFDALHYQNFGKLNKDIGRTVNSALDEAKKNLGKAKETVSGDSKTYDGKYDYEYKYNYEYKYDGDKGKSSFKDYSANGDYGKGVKGSIPGNTASWIMLILGIIGTGVFTLLTVGGLIAALIAGGFAGNIVGATVITFMVLDAASVGLIIGGASKRGFIKKFKRFAGVIGKEKFYKIEELAAQCNMPTKSARKDLIKMIEKGMFSHGHTDDEQEYFIADDKTYRDYLNMKAGRDSMKKSKADKAAKEAAEGRQERELRLVMEKGEDCLKQIREANDAIPGEKMSNDLDKMEDTVHKIFMRVEKNPSQLPEIRKFLDYYLPTTLKLVNTYKDFETTSVDGVNVSQAKEEIEKTLSTIENAFEKLLDSLYEADAMDISTDISVLKTMLNQDSLTDDELQKKKEEE